VKGDGEHCRPLIGLCQGIQTQSLFFLPGSVWLRNCRDVERLGHWISPRIKSQHTAFATPFHLRTMSTRCAIQDGQFGVREAAQKTTRLNPPNPNGLGPSCRGQADRLSAHVQMTLNTRRKTGAAPGTAPGTTTDYSPVNFPRRFSNTAVMPSARSLVPKHSTAASTSNFRFSSYEASNAI